MYKTEKTFFTFLKKIKIKKIINKSINNITNARLQKIRFFISRFFKNSK